MNRTTLRIALGVWTMVLAGCSSNPKDVTVGLGNGTSALGAIGEPPRTDGTCDVRLVACAGTCVDLSGDTANCGSCGQACATGQSCTSGACVTPPPPPPVDAGVAADASTAPDASTCAEGKASCAGACIDILFDNANCGACAVVCASGTKCERGLCM